MRVRLAAVAVCLFPSLLLAQGDWRNEVEIVVRGDVRLIASNGIPDHEPGRFPNRGNPNAIRPQRHAFRMPLAPEANRSAARQGSKDIEAT